jgi:transposase
VTGNRSGTNSTHAASGALFVDAFAAILPPIWRNSRLRYSSSLCHPRKKGDQAIGRSRGGLSTKIHVLCGSESDAVDIRITAGQAGDAPMGEELIDAIDTREGIRQAAMDKAYDSNAIRAKLEAKGINPIIPPKANRLEIIVYDKEQYKQRNTVERLFNRIKQFRRVATRYEKLKETFLAFVILALIIIVLR